MGKNKMPEKVSEVISAARTATAFATQIMDLLGDLGGNPQDLAMVASDGGYQIREFLAEKIYVNRFILTKSVEGDSFFLVPQREMTVGEILGWLSRSPYMAGPADTTRDTWGEDLTHNKMLILLDDKPLVAVRSRPYNFPGVEINFSDHRLQAESVINSSYCIPVVYRADRPRYHRVLDVRTIWDDGRSEYLLELTRPISITEFLKWLKDNNLEPCFDIEIEWLVNRLRHDLKHLFGMAFSRRYVINLYRYSLVEEKGYPIVRFDDRNIKQQSHWPATSDLQTGAMVLVKTDKRG